ncbi:MAG: DNA repair protein RecO [Oligoflexia bacterium]|nr:DNA repair protein RecO [Oligoflexia bacterium]
MSLSAPELLTVEAIVLRAFPYGESDLVLRLLCREHGKTSAMAKHARNSKRRYSTRFDIFDHGIFSLHHGRGSMPSIRGYNPGTGLRRIREDLAKLSAAALLCEACDSLIPDSAPDDDSFFDVLLTGLLALNESPDLRETLRNCYCSLGTILTNAGYLDPQALGSPSSKNMLKLISAVETHSDHELVSKSQLASFFPEVLSST